MMNIFGPTATIYRARKDPTAWQRLQGQNQGKIKMRRICEVIQTPLARA
jgi:hypothetical protein